MQRIAVYTTIYPGVETYLTDLFRSLQAQTDENFQLWIGLDGIEASTVEAAAGVHLEAIWVSSEPGATPARMKLAFGLLATMRGMPQIYYGDEIAMPGGNDPDNRRDFPGGFPEDANDSFTAAGRTPVQESMHAWVQGLLQLRAHHAVLQSGAQQDLLVDDTGMVFARLEAPPPGKPIPAMAQGDIVLVLLNKATTPRTFHLDFSDTALEGIHFLTPLWNAQAVEVTQNHCDVTVGAQQLIVLQAHR